MSNETLIPQQAESQFDTALSILQRVDGYDEKISSYISFRACYFSISESLKMANATKKELALWYEDEDFHNLDTKLIKEFQKAHGKTALTIQYTRNFRLVVQKDAEVIAKSLDPDSILSKFEEQYLNRLRGTYSPEQLQKLTNSVQDGDGKTPLTFMQVVMMANGERKQNVGKSQPENQIAIDVFAVSPSIGSSSGDSVSGELCPK
jgi:hypothetical protein